MATHRDLTSGASSPHLKSVKSQEPLLSDESGSCLSVSLTEKKKPRQQMLGCNSWREDTLPSQEPPVLAQTASLSVAQRRGGWPSGQLARPFGTHGFRGATWPSS